VPNKYVQVEGHTSLVRDMDSGAVINTNRSDYERYIKQKRLFQERNSQIEQINKHTSEINSIKDDLQEIKSMLLQMVKNVD
jgi:hypothetical protein